MPDGTPSSPQSSIILYQTEDGRTRIQCRFEAETIWLTQALIAELFQTTPQNVTLHLKEIFAEGELVEAATCKDYLQVRREGSRDVSRKLGKVHRTKMESAAVPHFANLQTPAARKCRHSRRDSASWRPPSAAS